MDRFRFQNAELQHALQQLYAAAGVPHEVEDDGALVCDEAFEAVAEALRSALRAKRFPEWRTQCVLDDPDSDDGGCRKAALVYLAERAIPFEVEEHDGECWLLLPEDEALPDSIWEAAYGSVGTIERSNPPCCFCPAEIEGESFAEISVRHADGAFRSVLYAHLDCLWERVRPEALHVLGTADRSCLSEGLQGPTLTA